MTVALVLAADGEADQAWMLGSELAELGIARVDAADLSGHGLLTVAAAARAARDRVLICAGAPPCGELARLLRAGGTAAFTGYAAADGQGALVVHPGDLTELAEAAEELAGTRRAQDPVGALLSELARRGVTVRVLDDGTGPDSQLSKLVIDPVAADIARWAMERELRPIAMYGISLCLGLLSALWFSELALHAKGFAIILLVASFLVGRAGHMVNVTARATQPGCAGRSPVASWVRLASAIIAEYAVYAGIAASAVVTRGAGGGLTGIFGHELQDTAFARVGGPGPTGVWRLAVVAMVFLAVRQMTGRCATIAEARAEPGRGGEGGRGAGRLFRRLLMFPAGERLAVLCASVVLVGPRFAFAMLLAWGALAFGYALTGLISAKKATSPGPAWEIAACRGDGALAIAVGRLTGGRIPPLLPLAVGLLVTCMVTGLGGAYLTGLLLLAPVVAMLLAAGGSTHPHDGPRDWLVPPLIQTGEYLYLVSLAFAHQVSPPVTFAVLSAVVLRHFELACRARYWPPAGPRVDATGFGWDGRMVLVGLFAVAGFVTYGYVLLAGYLCLLLSWDFIGRWVPTGYRPRTPEELRVVRPTSRRRPAQLPP
jgi:Family of unknown function (DUF5941)